MLAEDLRPYRDELIISTKAGFDTSWVLRRPEVTSALIGASSAAQFEDSLGALDAPELTDAEVARIDEFAVDGTGR